MIDKELCEKFGTTLEEVEADTELYEGGDFSNVQFGSPVDGKPRPKNEDGPV